MLNPLRGHRANAWESDYNPAPLRTTRTLAPLTRPYHARPLHAFELLGHLAPRCHAAGNRLCRRLAALGRTAWRRNLARSEAAGKMAGERAPCGMESND